MPSRAWQMIEHRLCIFIKFSGSELGLFFERMPDHYPGFMVLNFDRARPFFVAVVGPSQIAGQNVFWALEPFKADDRGGSSFGLAMLDAAPSECINLLARSSLSCAVVWLPRPTDWERRDQIDWDATDARRAMHGGKAPQPFRLGEVAGHAVRCR